MKSTTKKIIRKNRRNDKIFSGIGLFSTVFVLGILAFLIGDILTDGFKRLSWDFITGLPSRLPQRAGIYTAMIGSLWILLLTAIISFPLGVAAGTYLEKYVKNGWLAKVLEINISNLAGVPSIIYGILGLEIFARTFGLGPSLLTGSLTLSLLILPIIIVGTRESIKAVPQSISDASYAMGATKWQTIWMQILPASMGGILTGIILALSRAVGEAAPLIVVGALAYVPFAPKSPLDEFSVLPIQIFNWTSRPQHGFIINAAAAIIVLLLITFLMNATAIYLRRKWQRKVNW